MATPNRNDPCPCGSGRKYKQCCGALAAGAAPGPAPADLMAGVRHHQAGRLDEAEAIYRQVLQGQPDNADALHMTGLVAYQKGRTGEAIGFMERAVRSKPDDPFALNNLGAAYLAGDRPREAADCFGRATAIKSDYGEALANLGKAMRALGNPEEAAACYRRALAVDPANSRAHNNLGNVLREQGRHEEAIACYRQALADPGNAEARNNLGVCLAAGGRAAEAVDAYRQALAIRPDYADAHLNLGNALRESGRLDQALASYREAARLAPQSAAVWLGLANALKDGGRVDEAAAGYREVLRLDPGNAAAGHLLAAITGAASDRAPGDYVAEVFDQYADRFDEHLVDGLGYRVPESLLARVLGHRPAAGGWDVLDLGCGTGLAGVAVAPYARQLVGIDLSGRMLEKARQRGIYQRLEQADLLAAMAREPESAYDLILAADVFVYLGRLDPVVARAACLLRPGGLLAFSVEALEALPEERRGDAGFVLHEQGRFAHGADYLRRLAGDSGLRLVELTAAQTRLEAGVPVQGWLVLMAR